MIRVCLWCALLAHLCAAAAQGQLDTGTPWPVYGGSLAGTRFSPLTQIDRRNVQQLALAWTYRTGDVLANQGRFEATPILVHGLLYVASPLGRVSALDPMTGAERWTFNPESEITYYGDFANRGVAYWEQPNRSGTCTKRIFLATIDARLMALDADSGERCTEFGAGGAVRVDADLTPPPSERAEYEITSPPLVLGNVVIVGSAISDNQRFDAPPGTVHAYDARTGAVLWSWDPIPRDSTTPGFDTWSGPNAHRTGAANVWSIMSADPDRGLVFLPVGSAAPDFYGGERKGPNVYANSVVALRAMTGEVVWHFQVVHHDLWDYDVPAQPVVFTLRRAGREQPAVAVATKMGHLFVLDRETGEPLFPVEERAVPTSDVDGEAAWPTQPFPVVPAPLVPHTLTPAQAFGLSDADRMACRSRIASLRYDGIFTPPSTRGTIIYPGNIGGMHWGGVSVDEERQLAIAPTNRLAFVVTLIPRDQFAEWRRTHRGEISAQSGTPYGMMREVLMAPNRVPCTPPPWGTLVAVDLTTGGKRWDVPLGRMVPNDVPDAGAYGSVNLGGVLLTRSGLAFVAGSFDETLRAFDVETGQVMWQAPLPAGGQATPMTYDVNGRQYVVIAAGGHDRLGTRLGDYLVAYTLGPTARPSPSRPIDGAWAGELRIEGTRFPATLTLDVASNGTNAFLQGSRPTITAHLAGTVRGDTLDVSGPFEFPPRQCRGTMTLQLVRANGGALLVGSTHTEGGCRGAEPEAGTASFRRDGQAR